MFIFNNSCHYHDKCCVDNGCELQHVSYNKHYKHIYVILTTFPITMYLTIVCYVTRHVMDTSTV